ncbi:hypothetical protein FF1_014514 [Malus domestica]
MNFDSSVSKDRAATAFAIRNYDGQVVDAGAFNLDGITILFAERMGLKGLKFARSKGFQKRARRETERSKSELTRRSSISWEKKTSHGRLESADWVTDNGQPNLQFFATHLGKSKVQEDAISINHNWFNAYNIRWVGDYYYKAMEYIEDIKDICDDFEGLCQQNLAANTGKVQTFEESLNSVDDSLLDFLIFLARFSLANLIQLCYHARKNGNHNPNSSALAHGFA